MLRTSLQSITSVQYFTVLYSECYFIVYSYLDLDIFINTNIIKLFTRKCTAEERNKNNAINCNILRFLISLFKNLVFCRFWEEDK